MVAVNLASWHVCIKLKKIEDFLQFLCKCHVVAGAKICYDTMLSDLSMHAGSFVASSDLQTDQFDCVILTMPVPQLLQLHGDIVQILGALLYIISFLECSVNK